jgi:hypothetical protein
VPGITSGSPDPVGLAAEESDALGSPVTEADASAHDDELRVGQDLREDESPAQTVAVEERRPAVRAEAVPDVAGARPAPPVARAAAQPSPPSTSQPGHVQEPREPDSPRPTCTAPQLRRFIKSRAYVPMHELRRRFAIDGDDDEVCPIDLDDGRIYVGLPAAEGRMLGELVRGGEVGYELSWDPRTPIVVGVYSMRPVSRA